MNIFLFFTFFHITEYGLEAKPSILGLQIVFLATRRDDGGYGYYCARQELQLWLLWCAPEIVIIIIVASISDNYNC